MRFICDQMCNELGRWLRAAGYDTLIVDLPTDDHKIYQKAVEEHRFLLSRDKYFKKIDPEGKTVIYLRGESLEEWTEQLKERGVDWLYSPFSRCLHCNTAFKQIEVPNPLPDKIPSDVKELWSCPTCGHLFWRGSHTEKMENQLREWQNEPILTVGFGGDLMLGRLVNENLDEVPPSYVWGDLLPVLQGTDLNLVNLENAFTTCEKRVLKVFNFKADPEKVVVLKEGQIQVVNLANNHILDYSEEGLKETLQVLDRAHILHVGAGLDLKQAKAPCIFEKKGIKIGILGCTDNESGWKATSDRPGTNYLRVGDLSALKESITTLRKSVDLLIVSIHWGPNMQQRPDPDFRSFAHDLIDLGVDILHGHSAHIFQGVELYKNKLILYDTGDLVDDYMVDPALRNDQSFYFVVKLAKKRLISLKMFPTQISNFQVNISDDVDQISKMKSLCKEFKTFPQREEQTLVLYVD